MLNIKQLNEVKALVLAMKRNRVLFSRHGILSVIGAIKTAIALHEALEAERAGVHSCHADCERPTCVLHRRVAELECHVGMARRLLQGAISPHSNDCYRADEWVERKVAWLRAVDIAAEKGGAA